MGTPLPTAIVTSDDMQALGVLKAMRRMNVSDICRNRPNNVPISLYQNESFTSVDVNANKLGFCCKAFNWKDRRQKNFTYPLYRSNKSG